MYRKLPATAATTLALVGGFLATAPAEAAATPSSITSVRATPGPGAGQVTFRWTTAGKNTSAFKIETGLTSFSKSRSSSLPTSGRGAKVFTVARTKRSVTLSAAQLRSAGASVESANHVYFRFSAVNGSAVRAYPYLQAVLPKAMAPKAKGSDLRMASFNVRSSKISSGPSWLSRASSVAREIRDQNPGIVAVQELGPGRADGRNATTTGSVRQTTSLENAMRSVGAGKYKVVRETPFIKPGVRHGTQGARLLYDTSRYTEISKCVEKTGKYNYSSSCSVELPRLAGDSASRQRSASYARFQDRRTGLKFWVASVHLDERHTSNVSRERGYEALRLRQIKAVQARLARVNTSGDKVIIAGDINSWQNNKGGYAVHDHLVSAGYFDGAAAQSRVNFQYSTVNHFAKRQAVGSLGFASRIDVVMVKGSKGAKRFKNVTKVIDSSRPSDHNLIVSDLVL